VTLSFFYFSILITLNFLVVFHNLTFLQMPANDTESKTIVFQVYDFDRFTKNDAVGEVKLSQKMVFNQHLKKGNGPFCRLGEGEPSGKEV
jgi:hypothetical protein